MILVIRVTDIVRQWEDIRGTGSIDYEIDFYCVTVRDYSGDTGSLILAMRVTDIVSQREVTRGYM